MNHFSAIVPQYLRLQRQLLTGVLLLLSVVAPLHADNIHILVDTDSRVLQVLRGTRVVASFEGVAIGRYGKSYFRRKGDNRTPLGKFRIGWITSNTRYHLFLGLTFPDLEAADRALQVLRQLGYEARPAAEYTAGRQHRYPWSRERGCRGP